MADLQILIGAAMMRGMVLALAAFYGMVGFIQLALTFIRSPFTFFSSKQRTEPACLSDPRYGVHGYAPVNGVKLHYVANGKKGNPLVVLIHGWPEFWYSWRNQLVALADQYYVVAFDLRGFGLSSKPTHTHDYLESVLVEDIRGLIEHLGYEKANVVGHDWGAGFSYQFAVTYPNMVNRLVISNFPYAPFQIKWLLSCGLTSWWYILFYQVPLLPELEHSNNDQHLIVKHMKSEIHGIPDDKKLTAEDIEAYKYVHGNQSTWSSMLHYPRASLCFESFVKRRERRRKAGWKWPRIQPKTLFLFGANDLYITPNFAYLSQSYCDDSTVKLIAGATHWVQQHQPEAYNAALREFFAQ